MNRAKIWVKNNVYIIILLILLIIGMITSMGCCPCRHMTTEKRDSIVTIVRESVIQKIDTVTVELPIERITNVTTDTSSTLRIRVATSSAWIDGGTLHHTITSNNYPLRLPIVNSTIYKDTIIYKDRIIHDTILQQESKKYGTFVIIQIVGFWILLLLITVSIIIRIFFKH